MIPNELLQRPFVLDQVAAVLVQSGKKQTARESEKLAKLRACLLPDSQVFLDILYESCGSDVRLHVQLDTKCSQVVHQWLVWDALQARSCTLGDDPYGAVLAAHNWIREPGAGTKAAAYKAYGRAWGTYAVHAGASAAYIAGILRLSNDIYKACQCASLGYPSHYGHPAVIRFADNDSAAHIRVINRIKLYQVLFHTGNMPVPNLDLVLPEHEVLPKKRRVKSTNFG